MQSLGVLGNDREELLPLLGVVHCSVQQRFDIALDGGYRGFQLVGDIGHEIPPDALQLLQVGDVVEHQQGAVAAVQSLAEHGAVDVQESRLAVAKHHFAFDRLLGREHGRHKFVEIDAAHDFGQGAAFGAGRLNAQKAGRGVVHAQQPLVLVDGQHAFHHAGKNGVAFVPLPHDRVELVFQVGGHAVERFGQAADFLRVGARKPVREVAAGEVFGVVAELFQGFDQATGDDQDGGGQQRGGEQADNEQMAADPPQGGIDR